MSIAIWFYLASVYLLFLVFKDLSTIYKNWHIFPMNNESNDFDDDFEYAVDAYEREDYETSYKLFLPLAEQGDAIAQYNLEMMHGNSPN